MARTYSNYINQQRKQLLNDLVDIPDQVFYENSMKKLGEQLGEAILGCISSKCPKVYIAGIAEDADNIVSGILDKIDGEIDIIGFACFWNHEISPFALEHLRSAPIIRRYQEPCAETDIEYLIFIKSLIDDKYAVHTNVRHLLETINPRQIIIATPVLFKGVQTEIFKDFEEETYSKIQFLYFAEDDVKDSQGVVLPGIGGIPYQRMGFIDQCDKNRLTPEIVKVRRSQRIYSKVHPR